MGIFRKFEDKVGTEAEAKAFARMRRLSTTDVLNWMDATGSGIARALDDYRRYGEAASLAEVRQGVEALLGCIAVLEEKDAVNPRA